MPTGDRAGDSWVSMMSTAPPTVAAATCSSVMDSSGHHSLPSLRHRRSTDDAPPSDRIFRPPISSRAGRGRIHVTSETRTAPPGRPSRRGEMVFHGSWFPRVTHTRRIPASRKTASLLTGSIHQSPSCRIVVMSGASTEIAGARVRSQPMLPCQSPQTATRSSGSRGGSAVSSACINTASQAAATFHTADS